MSGAAMQGSVVWKASDSNPATSRAMGSPALGWTAWGSTASGTVAAGSISEAFGSAGAAARRVLRALAVFMVAAFAALAGACDGAPSPAGHAGYYEEPGLVALETDALDAAMRGGAISWDAPSRYVGVLAEGEALDRLVIQGLGERTGAWSRGAAVEWTWREGRAWVGRVAFEEPVRSVRLAGGAPESLQLEALAHAPDWELPLWVDLAPDLDTPKNTLPTWVIRRAAWGARSRSGCGSAHTPRYITIHHTATPNNDSLSPAARMRQMQAYHIDVLGWCDFGYHFTVGIDGQVYEGRANERRTGSHVGGHNTNNVGVSVVGNFVSFAPRAAQLDGLVRIGQWLTATYGITRNRTFIRGHRDWPGHTSNACPGNLLYAQLPTLIQRFGSGAAGPSCPAGACTAGTRRCAGGGIEICADHNGDGCPTWAAGPACGCGQQCEGAGVCVTDPSVCCPAPVDGAAGTFADIAPDDAALPVAERLFTLGITSGCSASPRMFCGGCRIDRAQAASLLARGLGLTPPILDVATFEDVPTSSPHWANIEALYAAGIVSGCSEEPRRFCPGDELSRAQAASILARAAELDMQTSASPVFSDVPADAWYRAAVETLHRQCIVAGCGTEPLAFCPSRPVTRTEFGRMLLRILDDETDDGPCCRPDALAGETSAFRDLRIEDPLTPIALEMFDGGVTSGCSADPRLFCGDCGVSRAQAASLIAGAGRREAGDAPTEPIFADVPASNPHARAIESLVAAGWFAGCRPDEGLFCPNESLTRAQAAVVLWRAIGEPEPLGTTSRFADVASDAWFAAAVVALDEACIADACTAGPDAFCASRAITRRELALWLGRAFGWGGATNCLAAPVDAGDGDASDGDAGDGDAGDNGEDAADGDATVADPDADQDATSPDGGGPQPDGGARSDAGPSDDVLAPGDASTAPDDDVSTPDGSGSNPADTEGAAPDTGGRRSPSGSGGCTAAPAPGGGLALVLFGLVLGCGTRRRGTR